MAKKYQAVSSLLLLSYILLSTGCATITKGSSQSITVNSNPQGALCELTREGVNIGFVNPTPGSVTIEKDAAGIQIKCKLDGYLTTMDTLQSSVEGMTFGNILLGGIIGVAIDAGSGAMNEYPTSFNVTFIPASFDTAEERDSYFDTLKAEITAKSEELATSKQYSCSTSSCKKKLKKLNAERDLQLAELDKKKLSATVKASE